MVPNVLRAYAFDIDKLDAFTALYNDLMLGDSGLEQARARDDRGGRVGGQPLLLLPGGAWCGGAAIVGRSGTGRDDGDELARGATSTRAGRRCWSFAEKLTKSSADIVEADRQALRDAGFSDRDIWDIAVGGGVLQHDQPGRVGHRHAAEPGISWAPSLGPVLATSCRFRPPRFKLLTRNRGGS